MLSCEFCGETYGTKRSLSMHQTKRHKGCFLVGDVGDVEGPPAKDDESEKSIELGDLNDWNRQEEEVGDVMRPPAEDDESDFEPEIIELGDLNDWNTRQEEEGVDIEGIPSDYYLNYQYKFCKDIYGDDALYSKNWESFVTNVKKLYHLVGNISVMFKFISA
jgi:hypothetical protein